MSKFVKNNKGTSETWAGQMIADGDYYQVQLGEQLTWKTDSEVIADIASGDLIVARDDSGTTDYSDVSEGMIYFMDTDPSPRDSDGSIIQRGKFTKSGWHYEPRSIDFFTAKHNSLYNRKHDGNGIADGTDYGDCVIKFFDGSGGELSFQQTGFESETDAQFQSRLDTDCVKTCVDWQPTYDMDIIGGIMMVQNSPTTAAYMWTIVAPDIPENMGGSVPHVAGGWNLSFFNSRDKIMINGRGSKTVAYDPVFNSNKFRTIVKHAVGEQIGIQIVYEHFKA